MCRRSGPSSSRSFTAAHKVLVPGAQAFDARMKADLVTDVERALAKPGHAIAVVPLRTLLAQGGVLDQLRSKGFTVTTPGDEQS